MGCERVVDDQYSQTVQRGPQRVVFETDSLSSYTKPTDPLLDSMFLPCPILRCWASILTATQTSIPASSGQV